MRHTEIDTPDKFTLMRTDMMATINNMKDLGCTTILKERTKKADFGLNQARIPVRRNTKYPQQVIPCIVEHIERWKALDTATCRNECHMLLVVGVDGVFSVATLEFACRRTSQ